MELFVVGIVALVTSILSALAGFGGGIILLAVLAQFYVPTIAIPVHGGIQLFSNGSRATFLRTEIHWRSVLEGSILLFPASLLGVAVATSVPEAATQLVLGVFLLVVAWRPGLLKRSSTGDLPRGTLIGVGAASGFLNSTVGASGPFTSPFFKAATATHRAFVATAATAQVIAHASKIVAFAMGDFRILDYSEVILVGIAGVLLGSWIGTRLLGKLPAGRLDRLFQVVLTVLAARLVLQAFGIGF